MATLTKKETEAYIRISATKRGIDPDTAVKVYRAEGASADINDPGGYMRSTAKNKSGVREPSYGPFQSLIGGPGTSYKKGQGNAMLEEGLDPRKPENVKKVIDWSLDYAAKNGWREWYGAEAVGIGDFEGLDGAKALGATFLGQSGAVGGTAEPTTVEDFYRQGLSEMSQRGQGGVAPVLSGDQGPNTIAARAARVPTPTTAEIAARNIIPSTPTSEGTGGDQTGQAAPAKETVAETKQVGAKAGKFVIKKGPLGGTLKKLLEAGLRKDAAAVALHATAAAGKAFWGGTEEEAYKYVLDQDPVMLGQLSESFTADPVLVNSLGLMKPKLVPILKSINEKGLYPALNILRVEAEMPEIPVPLTPAGAATGVVGALQAITPPTTATPRYERSTAGEHPMTLAARRFTVDPSLSRANASLKNRTILERLAKGNLTASERKFISSEVAPSSSPYARDERRSRALTSPEYLQAMQTVSGTPSWPGEPKHQVTNSPLNTTASISSTARLPIGVREFQYGYSQAERDAYINKYKKPGDLNPEETLLARAQTLAIHGANQRRAATIAAGAVRPGVAGAGAPVYPGSTKNKAQYPGARTKVEGGYSVTGATKSGKKYTSTHDRDSRGRRRETHTIAGGGTYVKNRRTRGYSLRLR